MFFLSCSSSVFHFIKLANELKNCLLHCFIGIAYLQLIATVNQTFSENWSTGQSQKVNF